MTAEKVLIRLIELLLEYVEELKDFKVDDENLFCYGERLAYTECLELIQEWNKAKLFGLDFNIEQKYPL